MRSIKRISILGSTGSIGVSTLDVVARHRGQYQVEAMAAHRNVKKLVSQIKRFHPALVAVADPEAATEVKKHCRRLKLATRVVGGETGVCQAATAKRASLVISAIVGQAGLVPTMTAIQAGKDIGLANKETLVTAGPLVMAAVKTHGVKLLPVDSEHAALDQCLHGHRGVEVKRLILTASGGPFAKTSLAQLRRVGKEDALQHPTWSMGRKITIDSATLMNKGLEVIEAHYLFGISYDHIEVVIHPQSIVHSMVEYVDGSTLAQLSSPDMRLPIQTALTAPARLASSVKPLDFTQGLNLTFGPPDATRFPCLQLAYQAGRQGGTAPAVLNAANEMAVQAFLEDKLGFLDIPKVIARVLNRHPYAKRPSLRMIQQADLWARQATAEVIALWKQSSRS